MESVYRHFTNVHTTTQAPCCSLKTQKGLSSEHTEQKTGKFTNTSMELERVSYLLLKIMRKMLNSTSGLDTMTIFNLVMKVR